MRIISINVNGIQRAADNGLFEWLAEQNVDVICLQDTRASCDTTLELAAGLSGYFGYASNGDAQRQSGVALFSRVAPKAVIHDLGMPGADADGRFIQADFDKVSVSSLLFPSGMGTAEAMAEKARFMQDIMEILQKQVGKRRNYIYCSSLFIAHKKSDVKFWRTAQHEIGFLPAERAWLDELINGLGYIDALRDANRDSDQFSYFADSISEPGVRLGWRFDYQLLTPGLRNLVRNGRILRNPDFSGHSPLLIDYHWQLR